MTARGQDVVLGAVFAALGLAAAWIASGYRGASAVYPLSIGLVMAGLGVLVAVRATLRSDEAGPRPLVDHGPRAAITVAIGAAYLALVPVLGFYLASGLAAVVLPLALGFRRMVYTLATTAIFMAIVWLIFAIVLEKPLPVPVWLGR